jgi:UDP-glucose 4-epimerase
MRVLVTGSAGHLGEALVRKLEAEGIDVIGLDIRESAETDLVGTILDRPFVRAALADVEAVFHTATLHKPQLQTHERQAFVETNVTGTLNLLEEAVAAGVRSFVFTSTTSTFGRALLPPQGEPAAWITEAVAPVPRNMYGATKTAAEDLCELIHRDHGLPCVVLRTSRFFFEADDSADVRAAYDDLNAKVNELLYRRVDLEDVVVAHHLALERAPTLGFGRYVVSATTPFVPEHLAELRADAAAVVRRLFPDCDAIYGDLGWDLPRSIDRVYVNARARRDLGWSPRWDFRAALDQLELGNDPRSELARAIGAKGYAGAPSYPHSETHVGQDVASSAQDV